jgi:hypothetical protein
LILLNRKTAPLPSAIKPEDTQFFQQPIPARPPGPVARRRRPVSVYS